MSQAIVIYRKGDRAPKVSTDTIKATEAAIAGKCRVKRPSLTAMFVPKDGRSKSDFYKAPALSPTVIDNPYKRQTEFGDCGIVVPTDSLGRKGEVSASQCQSILLWIKQNLSGVVNAEDVSVVVEER